jgi:hypothetical protein
LPWISRRPKANRFSSNQKIAKQVPIWGNSPRENHREVTVKRTIIALSLAAFAMSSFVSAYAAEKMAECKPAKKGYHLVDGKCVADKKMKK